MQFYRSHVLVCAGTGCTSSGSAVLFDEFEQRLKDAGIENEVKVVKTGCFGLCAEGPIVVVYPEGAMYCRCLLYTSSLTLHYDIDAADFSAAGEASSGVKRTLNKIGVNPAIVKRVAIAMYEAEINAIIHAGGGEADIEITPEKITVKISDHGPGIPDIAQAMTAGWSTACLLYTSTRRLQLRSRR